MARHVGRGLTLVVCLAVVALVVDSAWAQRGRGFRRTIGVSKAQLASLPEIQSELKMSDEQKTRVAEINDQLRAGRREIFGTGFDVESLGRKAGLGFVSMRERLRVLRGTVRVDSEPSRGTKIDVWVPAATLSSTVSSA